MPPPKSSRMTANPVKPSRYRAGKPIAEEHSSDEDQQDDSNASADDTAPPPPAEPSRKPPPPKATSFPADAAKKVSSSLRNVDLNARRRQDEARAQEERRQQEQMERDAGFYTESESGSEDESQDEEDAERSRPAPTATSISKPPRQATGSESASDDASDASESASDSSDSSAPAPRRAAPVFIRKDQRNKSAATRAADTVPAAAKADADAARRAAATDAIVQEQLERDAAARAAGKKAWDDNEPDALDAVDDTDGLDAELERQQWVARELARIRRGRAALEAREAELAEAERRRNLAPEEREAEDRAHVAAQEDERRGRGKAGFMQRYHHKGAFYNDEDARERGLLSRDLMAATYEGGTAMKEALPQFLQVRDETMIGRKGRTKYRDLKTEDTGRWGDLGRDVRRRGGGGERGGRADFGDDERFRPDYEDRKGATGANASSLGERKRAGDDGRHAEEIKRPRREEGRI